MILASRDRMAKSAQQMPFDSPLRAQPVIGCSGDQITAALVEPSSLVHQIQAKRVCHRTAITPPAPATNAWECPVRQLHDLNREQRPIG